MATAALLLLVIFAVRGSDGDCPSGDRTDPTGQVTSGGGQCASYTCQENGYYTKKECSVVQVPPGHVKTPVNTFLPFPECCGAVVPLLDVVPDVLDHVDGVSQLGLYYNFLKVDQGMELTPTQVKSPPLVVYTSEPEAWYLLCMTDPDAPSRQEPTSREFVHWLVGNIPAHRVSLGDTLFAYVGAGPPKGTGLHRYFFFVYKQPGKLTFDEPRVSNTSAEHRRMFSIRKFAQKYNMSNPVGFNVYQAQYDDYVPELHKQLGLKGK